jgi:type I restriction enzyme M protein
MWRRRGDADGREYADEEGFCKSATTEEIAAHGYVLSPSRYAGTENIDDDDEPFDDKMQRLVYRRADRFLRCRCP